MHSVIGVTMICKTKVCMILFFCVSLFNLEAQIILPDIRLTYGRDALFRDTLTTTEIFVNEPFYLLVQLSGSLEMRGLARLNPFRPQEFYVNIVFTSNDLPLINISMVEANTSVALQSPEVLELLEKLEAFRAVYSELSEEEREIELANIDRQRDKLSREELLFYRNFDPRYSLIKDAYYGYQVAIPLRPTDHITRVILRIDPLETGIQEILFRFGDLVPSIQREQIYRFSILPVQERR